MGKKAQHLFSNSLPLIANADSPRQKNWKEQLKAVQTTSWWVSDTVCVKGKLEMELRTPDYLCKKGDEKNICIVWLHCSRWKKLSLYLTLFEDFDFKM